MNKKVIDKIVKESEKRFLETNKRVKEDEIIKAYSILFDEETINKLLETLTEKNLLHIAKRRHKRLEIIEELKKESQILLEKVFKKYNINDQKIRYVDDKNNEIVIRPRFAFPTIKEKK